MVYLLIIMAHSDLVGAFFYWEKNVVLVKPKKKIKPYILWEDHRFDFNGLCVY